MNKYAIIDMEKGRIIVSSYDVVELISLIKEYRKAGYNVALVKMVFEHLWEYLDEEV